MSKESNWLYDFRTDIRVAQHGEEGVIAKIFEVLPPKNKYCVEFGAWDGLNFSNTYLLIKEHGWSSVQIEPNGDRFPILKERFAEDPVICLQREVGFKPGTRLDEILKELPVPKDFDLLFIDIDGYDYQTWEAFVDYRPRVVCIEFNPLLGHAFHIQRVPPVTGTGSSLKAVTSLGKVKGYELIAVIGNTLGINAFFVLKEDFALFDIEDNDFARYIDEDGNWPQKG